MMRIIAVMLAFLAGILFPVLIWVALFIALRRPLLYAMRRIGSAVLALLTGIFFPALIWVGLGIALRHKVREWKLRQVPSRTIGEILASAKLAMQWDAPDGESAASAIFVRQPMSEIRGVLVRVGL